MLGDGILGFDGSDNDPDEQTHDFRGGVFFSAEGGNKIGWMVVVHPI